MKSKLLFKWGLLLILAFLLTPSIINAQVRLGAPTRMPEIIAGMNPGMYPYGSISLGRNYVYSKRNDFKIYHYEGIMPIKNHLYSIILKSGDTLQAKVKMRFNNGRSYMMLKNPGTADRKILPKDTKQIYIIAKDGRKMIGQPSFGDTSWLFQVSKKYISTFAVIPEWGTDYISAVQKDTLAPPVRITQPTIVSMVKDDPVALKKAKKRLLILAIKAYNEDVLGGLVEFKL